MISPVQIRKAALGLLYALLQHGSSAEEFDYKLFWNTAAENDMDRFRQAQTKAILHCLRGQDDTLRLLNQRTEAVLNALHGDGTAAKLAEQVESLLVRSSNLSAATKALQYCVTDKRRDGTEQLALCCSDVLKIAATLVSMGEEAIAAMADFPAYSSVLKPLEAVIKRRARFLRECAELRYPRQLAGNAEYAALVRLDEVASELPVAAQKYATEVFKRRHEFEARLTPVLEHFTSERLAVVDKCILYISLYELITRGLKVQIVVSEAAELAHAYSGGKSAPFIHGVLAAIAEGGKKA